MRKATSTSQSVEGRVTRFDKASGYAPGQLVARRGERRRPRGLPRRNPFRRRHGRDQGHPLLERREGDGLATWRSQQSDRHRQSISTATSGSEISRRGGSRSSRRPGRCWRRPRRRTSSRRTSSVGRGGDVYAFDGSSRAIIRFAEDKSKPATANIPGTISVSGGTAKIAYTLSGVACPAEIGATATLTGAGISGKAASMKLKAREEHDPDEAHEGHEREGDVQDRPQDERAPDHRDAAA